MNIALNLVTTGFNAGLNSAGQNLNSFTHASDQQLKQVAQSAAIAGAAMLAGFGIAAKASMDFEQQMSNVAAVSGATGAEFDALREQAIQLGSDTVFSATEVAKAQEELAKAGVSTAAIMGGALKGTLDLAAAANLDLAQAAEIAATSMNNFGLFGRDVPHIADVLAASANKSAADVSDMALALKQAGAQASLVGMDFEETAAALSIFANSGVKGSDAGTSLKVMLTRLKPTTEDAITTMNALGLTFEDGKGGFVDMATVAERLRVTMSGLNEVDRSTAMQTIFGQDALRAATFLYEQGADGVNTWTEKVDDSGYAAEVARIKMDNLAGDVEKLGGAIDSALIKTGSEANGSLRSLVQTTTNVVSGIGSMPAGFSQVGLGLGATAIAATGLVAGFGTFIPMARNVKGALDGMGGAFSSLAGTMTMRNLAGLTAGAIGITAAFVLVTSQIESAKAAAKEAHAEFMATLNPAADVSGYRENLRLMEDQYNSLVAAKNNALEEYAGGLITGDLARGFQRASEAFNPFGDDDYTKAADQLSELQDSYRQTVSEARGLDEIVNTLAGTMGTTGDEVEAFAAAQGIDLVSASQQAVTALNEQGKAVEFIDGKWRLTSDGMTAVGDVLNMNLIPAMNAAKVEANLAPPVVGSLEEAITASGDAALTASERFDAYKNSVDAAIGIQLGQAETQRNFTESVWAARDAVDDLNEKQWWGFNNNTPEAFKYKDAMDAMIGSYGDMLISARETGASQEEMNAIQSLGIQTLEDMAREGKISAQELAYYRDVIMQIPATADTNITAPGMAETQSGAVNLNATLDAIERERRVQISMANAEATMNAWISSHQGVPLWEAFMLPTHANGGIFNRATAGIFGEAGTEVIVPMTRPARARELADRSGLTQMLHPSSGGGSSTTFAPVVNVSLSVSAPNYHGPEQAFAAAVAAAIDVPGVADRVATAVVNAQRGRDGSR